MSKFYYCYTKEDLDEALEKDLSGVEWFDALFNVYEEYPEEIEFLKLKWPHIKFDFMSADAG